MPDLGRRPDIIHAVAYLARHRHIDLIVALDDFDVETAAHLREHFRLPGMGDSLARNFRDKLAMRTTARNAGLLVPEFTGVFNYDDLREFMARVSPPWLLKPRSEASSMGIKKINHADEIWPILESLGDQQSFFLMEQFVAGDVYHVDGLVNNSKVLFSMAHKYGQPPLSVYSGGGVFLTRSLDRESDESESAGGIKQAGIKGNGVGTRARPTPNTSNRRRMGVCTFWKMLPVWAALTSPNASIMPQVSICGGSGRESKLRTCVGRSIKLPQTHSGYAGIINCLAHQEWPDLSGYNDPEVVWRMNKKISCRADRLFA